MERINPRVDLAFKKIFGVEENKDLLISLINSVVSEEDRVVDLTLLNPYNPKNFREDKLSVLDIKAEGEDGRRFNIEMQISDEADYDKRALYYWAKLYTEQLKSGDDYRKLSKAIGIHILNFLSIVGSKKYHNVFRLTEQDSGIKYFKNMELHTVELNKFSDDAKEELSDLVTKVKTGLDMWVAFLTRHDLLNKDKLPHELNNPNLKKALGVLEVINLNGEERQLYEDHLGWLRMESSILRKKEQESKEEGRAEGRAEGEAEQAVRITKNLLAQGINLEIIAKATGLSKEQIKKLKN